VGQKLRLRGEALNHDVGIALGLKRSNVPSMSGSWIVRIELQASIAAVRRAGGGCSWGGTARADLGAATSALSAHHIPVSRL